MKNFFITPPHATPIDDISDLKLSGITSYRALCNQEAESILRAKGKYFRRTTKLLHVSEGLIKRIHVDMFGPIWKWAGKYRKTITNIGVKPYLISVELMKLCEDLRYWESNSWNLIERGAQLHHRLVAIHPFENGNGRHARFISDLYLHSYGHPIPKWPVEISEDADLRTEYIQALREGDSGNINSLISYMIRYC